MENKLTLSDEELLELLSLTVTDNKYGDRVYRNNKGQLHRSYGPAVEKFGGYKEWHKNGKLHRDDGPAIEVSDEYKEWYLDGKRVDPF